MMNLTPSPYPTLLVMAQGVHTDLEILITPSHEKHLLSFVLRKPPKLNQSLNSSFPIGVLVASYPPSAGAFSYDALNYLRPIVQFLAANGAPLLVNVYPYFSYVGYPSSIKSEFALFTSMGTFVIDTQHWRRQEDLVYRSWCWRVEWPSAGGIAASISNAKTYNQNLKRHVGQGTPKRPGRAIEAFLLAMFNENQKPQRIEKKPWALLPKQAASLPCQLHLIQNYTQIITSRINHWKPGCFGFLPSPSYLG